MRCWAAGLTLSKGLRAPVSPLFQHATRQRSTLRSSAPIESSDPEDDSAAHKRLRPLNHQYQTPRGPGGDLSTLTALPHHRNMMVDLRNPLRIPRMRAHKELYARQALVWSVQSPHSVSANAVVRNWARRRVKAAFKAALALRGWDDKGFPLASGVAEEGVEQKDVERDTKGYTVRRTTRPESGEPQESLEGSLLIMLGQDILTTSFGEVQERCALTVQSVVSQCHTWRKRQRLAESRSPGEKRQRETRNTEEGRGYRLWRSKRPFGS